MADQQESKETVKDEMVLVTGASGYIAGHIIKQLLQKGYNVRGTVRSLKNAPTKYKHLYDLQTDEQSNKLELVEADLTSDDKWDSVIDGCSYIMSVASPVPRLNGTVTDDEMVETAVGGIKRILAVCLKHKSQIKRLIFTSSVAAMGAGVSLRNKSMATLKQTDWSNPGLMF